MDSVFTNKVIPWLMHVEGFFSDDENDRGGATKYGISVRYLKGVPDHDGDGFVDGDLDRDGDVDIDDIHLLTAERAKERYYVDFWQQGECNLLPAHVALSLMDGLVNHRPKTARLLVQRALKVKPDGYIGPITRKAANKSSRYKFLPQFFILSLPALFRHRSHGLIASEVGARLVSTPGFACSIYSDRRARLMRKLILAMPGFNTDGEYMHKFKPYCHLRGMRFENYNPRPGAFTGFGNLILNRFISLDAKAESIEDLVQFYARLDIEVHIFCHSNGLAVSWLVDQRIPGVIKSVTSFNGALNADAKFSCHVSNFYYTKDFWLKFAKIRPGMCGEITALILIAATLDSAWMIP